MIKTQFRRLPRSLLQSAKRQDLFQNVAEGISPQVENARHVPDLELLAQAPVPAQVIYWLWRFRCEAGVNGMDVFVLNSRGLFSPQVHAALKAVGATQLVHLLEAAIA